MFDAHAHIGDIITPDAIVCTSRPDEYIKAGEYPYRAYGLLSPLSEDALSRLYSAVKGDSKALIGEFGVDRRWSDPLEEKVLYSILSLAEETARPFVLHQVGHTDILLKALDSFKNSPPFILHGFTGSSETADEIERRGGIISLGPRSAGTRDFMKLIKKPFLLESDLPTGENQSLVIDHWYKAVAEYLEIEMEKLVERIDAGRAVFTT